MTADATGTAGFNEEAHVLRSRRVFVGAFGALVAVLTLSGCGAPPVTTSPGVENKVATSDDTETGIVVTRVVAKKLPRIGNVVTDSKGWIFYRFDGDSAKPPTSNCNEDCAFTWPPVLVEDEDELPAVKGVDRKKLGTVERDDGTWQLTIGGWPMYRYTGDEKVGQWQGQGAGGGTWFVATKDGKKNLAQLQEVSSDDESEQSSSSDEEDSSSEDTGSGDDGGTYGGY